MNGGALTIQYDGDGNRVAKRLAGVTTRYLVDDLNPTDATSAVINTYDYDSWGNAVNSTGSTPNIYLHRGEQYDPDVRLYRLRARYFDPLTGQFLSHDPESGHTEFPAPLHRYIYAAADPVNRVDPNGRDIFGYTLTLQRAAAVAAIVGITSEFIIGIWECLEEDLRELERALHSEMPGTFAPEAVVCGPLAHEHQEMILQRVVLSANRLFRVRSVTANDALTSME